MTDCAICLQTVISNQLKTSCQHEFHYPCLIRYYITVNPSSLIEIGPPSPDKYNERKLLCPLCRTELDVHSIYEHFLKENVVKGNCEQLFQTLLTYDGVQRGNKYIFFDLNKTNWFPLFYQLVKLESVSKNPIMKIYNLMVSGFKAGFKLVNIPYSIGIENGRRVIDIKINKESDPKLKELDLLLNRIGQSIVTGKEKIFFSYLNLTMRLRFPNHERGYVIMDTKQNFLDKNSDNIPQVGIASFTFDLDFYWNNLDMSLGHINASNIILIYTILTSMMLE